jgi:glycosyltransferase involved in cell wall biosynthesis
MPEVAGKGACFVDPYSVDSIRKGILKVIEDSVFRENIISEGLLNIERFKPDLIASQYASLYKRVYLENSRN